MRATLAFLTGAALALGSIAPATAAEIVIGAQCDRTGPTQTVGTNLCPGFNDYIKLINSKGGVMGHTIRADEVDNEYKVPPAVESYERYKKEGAVTVSVYGTPQVYALTAEAHRGPHPRHLARLRQGGGGRRDEVPLHLPHRGHLLVAGRGGGEVRQGSDGGPEG